MAVLSKTVKLLLHLTPQDHFNVMCQMVLVYFVELFKGISSEEFDGIVPYLFVEYCMKLDFCSLLAQLSMSTRNGRKQIFP